MFKTLFNSLGVRTKGIMTWRFFSPPSILTFRIAVNSSRNAGSYDGSTYLLAPLQPIIGLSSWISYFSPPWSSLYSFVLRSESRNITGRGENASATFVIPSAKTSMNFSVFPVSIRCIGCSPMNVARMNSILIRPIPSTGNLLASIARSGTPRFT